jgi:5'-deoxynucleotidase YfbR-like HD superfamily hydrolase
MIDLQKVLDFSQFLNDFSLIQRRIFANGEDRLENDSEHSFQLAMLAWYIVDTNHIDLDTY